MPPTIGGIGIDPQGQTVTVSVKPAAKVYTDSAGSTLASFPQTISGRTSYFVASAGPYAVSVLFNGAEIAGPTGSPVTVQIDQGQMEWIAPTIDQPAENPYGTWVPLKDTYNKLDLRTYGLDSTAGQVSAVGLANMARLRQAVADASVGQTILAPAGYAYFETSFDLSEILIGCPIVHATKHVTIEAPSQDATTWQLGPTDVPAGQGLSGFFFAAVEPGIDFTLRNITVQGPLTNPSARSFQGLLVMPGTGDGTGLVTVDSATLDYFTIDIKGDSSLTAAEATENNRTIYIAGTSIIRNRADGVNGGEGVLLTGGANLVVRGKVLFDSSTVITSNQHHNIYSHYLAGVDIDCAGGEFRECGGGYNIQFFGGPIGPPRFARVAGMRFTGTQITGGILTHKFARASSGGSLVTETEMSRLVFANTTGVALHAVGDWTLADSDLVAPTAGIQAYTTGPLGNGRVLGGLIRSYVQAGTAGVGSGYKWQFKGTRFKPAVGDSAHSAQVRCITTGATIVLDDCEMNGVADKTAQVNVTNGKIILRRTVLDNLNDAGQKLTITGAPTGGTFRAGDPITTIAAGSDTNVLPQATINVADTTNMPASGNAIIATSLGNQTVAYTGKTGTTLTGATGGTGTLATGGTVASASATIAYNADADAVRLAVQGIASIGANNVNVTPVAPFTTNGAGVLPSTAMSVTFQGTLAGAAHSTLIADASGLTGGTSPAVTVTSTVTGGAVTGVSAATTASVIDGSASFTNPATALSVATGSPTGTLMPFNPGGGGVGTGISSSGTIAVPFGTTVFHLTGTSAVATINVQASTVMPLVVGYTITVIFDSTATMTAAGNIANAVGASAGQVKTLIWDGTKWQG